MSLIYNIRQNLAFYLLNRRLKKTVGFGERVNFSDALVIGVVYSTEDELEKNVIKDYIKGLKEQKKEVHILEYHSNEKITNELQTRQKKVINERDINFFNLPKKKSIEGFQEITYDMLIFFGPKSSLPLNYIVATSNARIKIGPYNPTFTNVFDFMVQIDDNEKVDVFIDTLKLYIGSINKN